MLRDLQEISDGKIYGCNDMVRAACGDCAGCHACCEKMGTSIVLDPCDSSCGENKDGIGDYYSKLYILKERKENE